MPPFELGKKKIVVMGLGYIGLPTASMLATKGHQVVGVDISSRVVDTINQGNIHILEPDLDILVKSAVNSGNLKATLAPEPAEVFIIAVPTPFKVERGEATKIPDVSFVVSAVRAIAPHLQKGNLVILESTSPVGTTELIDDIFREMRPDLYLTGQSEEAVFVAHCPERVLPGHILRELVDNDRIVGGINSESSEKAGELYKSFSNGKIFLTDSRTAEMAKLVENSFRDVNIAFANELSLICDALGVNVWELIDLANRHPRVNVLQPGPGVGGHCIAVDPWFIVSAVPDRAKLIRVAREVNEDKPNWVVLRVLKRAERFRKPVIGCLGLAFKANIDDLRESPALEIARRLNDKVAGEVIACEPNCDQEDVGGILLCGLDELLDRADIVVVLVDHDEFKQVDRERLKEKVVVDTRGLWR